MPVRFGLCGPRVNIVLPNVRGGFMARDIRNRRRLTQERSRATFRRVKTNRVEAFSDGVMAILITIMVLELKAPHDPTPSSLANMWPTFFAYILSFIILAIYWVNHHHLIHLVTRVIR
jgi:hypothetical protein